MSKQYNTKLQERLEKFLKDENLSQAKAAPILGISQAALSQYRRSMYDKGDIEAVENKLKEFFQIQEEKTQNAQKAEPFRTKTSAGYIPTTISEEAYKLIRYCQLEKGIVVIDGDAGIGKTKAAAKFLQDNPSTTVYVKATPSTGSTRSLLKMIAKTLKLPENQRTEDLSVSIQEKLRETDKVIIIDEAQNLKFLTLEEIRGWVDEDIFTGKPGIGIVLIGNVEVYNKMLGKQEAIFAQQFNRTNEWIERAKQRVLNNAEITDQSVKEIMFLFDEAAWTLETEINSMFQKYATENGLTNAEASKLLTGSEYSRWKKGIEEYLKEAEGDSKTLLELNTLAMKSRISRKEQMLATVYQTMITLSRDTETKITDLLGDMFKTNYYRGCYDVQSILGVGFNVSKVDVKMLQRILKHPWSGKNYSQALWENTDKLATLAKRELTMGFMNGSSVQKMAKEINDVMGKGRYAAERLVRTESSYFSNQGELASYREMGIQEYTFLGGGCEICMELNGQSFPLDEAEPGLNLPPIHPNCKCTIKAKAKIDLFKDREGVNPLESNPKFEEWKKKYVDTPAPEPIIKLSENEQHAINSYISSEAYTWNDKLRRGVKLTKEEKKQISNLDSALQKMPTYQGVLYRSVSDFGIPDVQEFIVGHKPGMEISFPEFLSSSTEVYDDSFPIQYVITSKTGRDIRKFNSQEKEILFERDSMFYISKVVNNVIYMEEI